MFVNLCCILVLILSVHSDIVFSLDNPEVYTNVGVIRGVQATDGDYDMYMGIPYAYVNETNPWGISIPQPPFQGVFEAFDDTARCPQVEEFNNTITGSLDCLHLNIYVPKTASQSKQLPVLVWIYGGYFSIGFHGRFLYGPKYLVRHDIILVTINYRLGPYGFMCLHTPEVPGNQGLKDQVTALRWIRGNIAAFGGDPSKVTIAGNSAGGGSVDLHVKSEIELLYDKAIIQSGSSMWTVAGPDVEYPLVLAKAAGYDTKDIDDALNYLKDIRSDDVIAAYQEIGGMLFPCPEKDFPGIERFLSDFPFNLDFPKAANVKFLVGYLNDEALSIFVSISPESYPFLNTFYDEVKRSFTFSEQELEEMTKMLTQFYNGDSPSDSEFIYGVSDFYSDYRFIHPAEMIIQDAFSNGATTVYRYIFTYSGGRNFVKVKLNSTDGGAYHADELGYLFDTQFYEEPNHSDDQLIIDRMTTLWANFVKYGNPTPSPSELLPVTWLPITRDASHYCEIGSELKTGLRPYSDRMAFWDLFYEMNIKQLKGYKVREST